MRVSQHGLTICSVPTWRIGSFHWMACLSCFGDLIFTAFRKPTHNFIGSCINKRYPWVPGLRNQTIGRLVIFDTLLGVKIPLDWGYLHHVVIVWPHREVTSWGTPPYRQSDRWSIGSSCQKDCTTPFRGIYSGAELTYAGRSYYSNISWITSSLRSFLFPYIKSFSQ